MSKLADPLPVVCSVCLQPPMVRNHELRYVDFEVAHEGPVLTRYGERAESGQTIPVSVDDLMICEECLRGGAQLIGMEPGEEMREQLADMKEQIHELRMEVAAKDRMISDQDHSLGVVIDHPVKRPARPPKVVGPDSHEDEIKKVRKRRRTAAKISKTKQEAKA